MIESRYSLRAWLYKCGYFCTSYSLALKLSELKRGRQSECRKGSAYTFFFYKKNTFFPEAQFS